MFLSYIPCLGKEFKFHAIKKYTPSHTDTHTHRHPPYNIDILSEI